MDGNRSSHGRRRHPDGRARRPLCRGRHRGPAVHVGPPAGTGRGEQGPAGRHAAAKLRDCARRWRVHPACADPARKDPRPRHRRPRGRLQAGADRRPAEAYGIANDMGEKSCAGRSPSEPRIRVVLGPTAGTLCGPLHTRRAVEDYQRAVEAVPQQVRNPKRARGFASPARGADNTGRGHVAGRLGARRAVASSTAARCSRTGRATL